mmetsp:Transcript_22873/g.74052  ORF Transcript_22873/g.74052 Transcript_22873/m.74052 type:complete len:222 (-) Transcript_22873:151-816(-)|eukprot:scaffold2782_cov112-Isochrysis_galbana.AAC.1
MWHDAEPGAVRRPRLRNAPHRAIGHTAAPTSSADGSLLAWATGHRRPRRMPEAAAALVSHRDIRRIQTLRRLCRLGSGPSDDRTVGHLNWSTRSPAAAGPLSGPRVPAHSAASPDGQGACRLRPRSVGQPFCFIRIGREQQTCTQGGRWCCRTNRHAGLRCRTWNQLGPGISTGVVWVLSAGTADQSQQPGSDEAILTRTDAHEARRLQLDCSQIPPDASD